MLYICLPYEKRISSGHILLVVIINIYNVVTNIFNEKHFKTGIDLKYGGNYFYRKGIYNKYSNTLHFVTNFLGTYYLKLIRYLTVSCLITSFDRDVIISLKCFFIIQFYTGRFLHLRRIRFGRKVPITIVKLCENR